MPLSPGSAWLGGGGVQLRQALQGRPEGRCRFPQRNGRKGLCAKATAWCQVDLALSPGRSPTGCVTWADGLTSLLLGVLI